MDRLASNYLSNGDVANASSLYNSLEKLNPTKYSRMARICRVLSDPQMVPLPHRHNDICDALLDPSVPPEVLLRSCAEDVQKSFQRLAVCVHPDKNPNPRAKDAFLRLTHMKDNALQRLQERTDGHGNGGVASAAAAQPRAKAAPSSGEARRPHRPPLKAAAAAATKKRPGLRVSPPLTPVTELQAATSVSTGLDQLRHTTIKLNCFKRKDIADDFEIFSATQRTAPSSAFGNSETSLAECGSDNDGLAATVPVMPRGAKAPPLRRRPRPPPSTAPATVPLATPLPVSSSTSTVDASPDRRPTSPPPSALPRIGSADAPRPMPDETEAEEGNARPASAAAFADGNDAIRQQIDQTCLRLQEMRVHNTNIKLKLDLSFEAYQRGKEKL